MCGQISNVARFGMHQVYIPNYPQNMQVALRSFRTCRDAAWQVGTHAPTDDNNIHTRA